MEIIQIQETNYSSTHVQYGLVEVSGWKRPIAIK